MSVVQVGPNRDSDYTSFDVLQEAHVLGGVGEGNKDNGLVLGDIEKRLSK